MPGEDDWWGKERYVQVVVETAWNSVGRWRRAAGRMPWSKHGRKFGRGQSG